MEDIVTYRPPLILGKLPITCFIKNQLKDIRFRFKAVEEIFGKFPS